MAKTPEVLAANRRRVSRAAREQVARRATVRAQGSTRTGLGAQRDRLRRGSQSTMDRVGTSRERAAPARSGVAKFIDKFTGNNNPPARDKAKAAAMRRATPPSATAAAQRRSATKVRDF